MARGTGRQQLLGSAGYPGTQEHTPYDFIYDVTTTINALYHVGDRVLLPNGKVFYYSYSGGRCYTGRGNKFWNTISSSEDGNDYSLLYEAAAAGSNSIVMTNQSSSAITADQFRNGQIVLKPTETYDDAELMFRGVVGNSSADASGGTDPYVTIYLDAETTVALTTSNYAFVMESPWWDIRYDSGTDGTSFAGLAAAYVSAASRYFWTQTWGMCWIAPQSSMGGTVGTYGKYRTCWWRHDGSIDYYSNIGTNVTDQIAGFIIDNNSDSNGATLINLTVTI